MEYWTQKLKVGDKVAYYFSNHYPPKIATVERLTKTQIILAKEPIRFRRDNGYIVGNNHSSWSKPYIEEYTEELAVKLHEQMKRNKALYYLRNFDFKEQPTDILCKIVEVLKDANSKSENSELPKP